MKVERIDVSGAVLEARDITYAYQGRKPVFEHISFSLRPGQVVCILGPNGAGKTTLLNCLANLVPLRTGAVCINGQPVTSMAPRQVAQYIGYVPQLITPSFDFSVLDYVVTGCAPRMGSLSRPKKEHYDTARQAIRDMGIEELAERSYMHISGGERQQVAIARALAQKPAFILMDEPTAHLDFGNQIKVLRTVRRMAAEGYGVLLTTHNPDHALLLGGKAAVLDRQGGLNFGDSEEILVEEALSELYGTELCLLEERTLGRMICVAPRLAREEPFGKQDG